MYFILLFVLGACMGSFLCCQARRLHLREAKHKSFGSRSICLSCKHQLKWYDNLPILSWLVLGGKCRYCHRKIGSAEFLSEFGLSIAFVALGTTFDPASASSSNWLAFATTLLFTLSLSFLAIYDALYGELPTFCLIISLILATTLAALTNISLSSLSSIALSIAVLGGTYLVLFLVSKGKWVGDGDWLLGTSIGMALGNPWLALLALFIANFSACLVMFPTVKTTKNKKIYFGPFLVLAYIIVATFAELFKTMV